MEARLCRAALISAILFSMGAGYRTTNFIVTAPDPQLAREIGDHAERFRQQLAIEWLGHELERWSQPCPITVRLGGGAGGATSFMFDQGRPFGWRMTIQGSRERLLDSVLPHEVTHTIFATHFGRPLPRWADEGACTAVEHESERAKQHQLLLQCLTTAPSRGIPFNRMFALTDYPRDILPLYAQGYSVVRYLIAQHGKRAFINYLADGMRYQSWDQVTQQHYGFRDLSELQLSWLDWVRQGSPPISAPNEQIASLANPPAAPDHRNRSASPSAQPRDRLTPVPPAPLGRLADAGKSAPGRPREQDNGSWYARQRDNSSNGNRGFGSSSANPPPATRLASSARSTAGQSITSRPQTPQGPRETVLAWDQSSGTSAGARRPSQSGQALPFVPNVRYDAPLSAGGTVWR